MFRKGENLAATDYQMVRHPDVNQGQRLYKTFGDKPVCLSDADYDVRLVQDCCYDPDRDAHEALLRSGFGGRVQVV